ncbi:HAD family hydrolase [Mahella sp.]|uniref:HAD family hydrolase n=1 Tax=Mahella sp. TaxID=2798721 RepID=UPI0025C27CC8|nr:HAD family hydrolase [Mahella sp.]MBZ4665557.1 Haloacid dehalogenase domain protein hydrolase [Mahella sp.]
MEIILELPKDRPRARAALFDFDGTISTLRHGWESIMEPFMTEMIAGGTTVDEDIVEEVREYIDASTGIQTIFQMQWLVDAVKKYGRNPHAPEDPWQYKAEYNRRLMEHVKKRITKILSEEKSAEDYLIKGSMKFLKALDERGIDIYAASGTDNADVVNEAHILGVDGYFKEIAGAPAGRADCSKEAVLKRLINDYGLKGPEVMVFGDGKVEIALGRQAGTIAIGVASDEEKRCGINPTKRQRLIKAGAHAIIGDFEKTDELLKWLGLEE